MTKEKVEDLILQLEETTPKTGKPTAKAKKAASSLISSKEDIEKIWNSLSLTAEQKLFKLWGG